MFLPKNHGGIGIHDQGRMNMGYMAKLGWRMFQDSSNLGQDCIRLKYIQIDPVKLIKKMGLSRDKIFEKGWTYYRKIAIGT